MWSRDIVPGPHQKLLTPDDGPVTRLRLSSLGGRGRCSSRISLGHSCGLIANIDDLEWIVFWLSTTLSWLKLLRLNEWWGCLCLQSKTKTLDKTDDTDFIQTRNYETEYLISVSTTPTFLQWSPNIDWLSTVHCDWPVCLSVWVSVLSMFAAHRAPVSQPSPSSDTGLLNRFGLALHGHGQGPDKVRRWEEAWPWSWEKPLNVKCVP